jgi:hypothetical protein
VYYFGVDPIHSFFYPIFGFETAEDLRYLCPPCHDHEHDRTGKYAAAVRDIDRLNFRRLAPQHEVIYEMLLDQFFARRPGELFYPLFEPKLQPAS